jgi:FKBP-type peptidyl-prolyl cis-trans isomerase
MKKTLLLSAAVLAMAAGCKTTNSFNASAESLANATDSLSYALGVSIGQNLKTQGVQDLNYALVAQGMMQQYDSATMMTAEDADAFIRGEFTRMRDAKEAAAKQEGLDYLDENGKKEGVITTASGLQYKILVEGDGAKPLATDQVTVHYEGRLINGEVFDSSYERGEPATFPLNGVIPGWTEGLQYISTGGKAELYIPSDLGYGSRGTPDGSIPPHSTLVFTVELISIN